MSYENHLWRVGRKVGRTIYVVTDSEDHENDPLIGIMDTPELAAEAIRTHNVALRTSRWTEPVYIARCPVHGLHGERSECFVCGGPVEQVPMIPVEGALTEEMIERARIAIRNRAETELADAIEDDRLQRGAQEMAEQLARAALLAAGPWTGKLDREKAIEVAWWRAERDRHQLRAERAEAELADLRAGRQHTHVPNPGGSFTKRRGDAR